MEAKSLQAQTRTILGKKVKKVRKQGMIPAILYGHDTEPQPLSINTQEFSQIFKTAGISALVNLKIDEQKGFKVLLKEPQRDPKNRTITHADIYKVKMSEKIKTEIPLEFINEAPAVVDLEGNLIVNSNTIEVECLPDDLIANIEVDLAALKTFDDMIHLKDIKAPKGVEFLGDPEEVIVVVSTPRTEEEMTEETVGEDAEKTAVAELAKEEETETKSAE